MLEYLIKNCGLVKYEIEKGLIGNYYIIGEKNI